MVNDGKEFSNDLDESGPFRFENGSYDPLQRTLNNQETGKSSQLPRTAAGLLKLLLHNSPNFVPLEKFRAKFWPGTADNFKQSFKTHLSTLRKRFRAVGFDPDLIERTKEGLRIRVNAYRQIEDRDSYTDLSNAVGLPPPGMTEHFRDRTLETEEVAELLLSTGDDLRAVNIFGRFGVGKTALACQVMATLQRDQKVERLAFMNPDSGFGIGLDQIFRTCVQLLGDEADKLREVWEDVTISTQRKIQMLVEQFRTRSCIILLDGLEKLMREGRLLDPEVDQFISGFLIQGAHRGRLLITSSEPVYTSSPDTRQLRYFKLDKGLPQEDAINFFQSLDPDGSNHLREIPQRLLEKIVERTLGFPRALQHLAKILAAKPTLQLKELLEKEQLFHTEIIEELGHEAHKSFDADELRVMQALSIFDKPVSDAGVAFLLQPFMTTALVKQKMDRLYRGKYINFVSERGASKFAAHQWDKALSYNKIPNDDSEYSKTRLHLRAAEFYVQQQPSLSKWTDLSSVEPLMDEFEQRLKGQDYEKAFILIETLDDGFLSAEGFHNRVISMREALRETLSDIRKASNLRLLSRAYLNAGKYDHANSFAREALEVARKFEDKAEEAGALLNAGTALNHLGQYSLAENRYQDALNVARAIKNTKLQSTILRLLGSLYGNLALHQKALPFHAEALTIAKATYNHSAQCAALRGMGTLLTQMGQLEKALDVHKEALVIARGSKNKRMEALCQVQIGVTFRELGDYETALTNFDQSLSISRDVTNAITEMKALGGRGKVYLAQSRNSDAQQSFVDALDIAKQLNMKGPQQHWETCLAQVYLYEGYIPLARETITKPRALKTPWNDYYVSLINGLILSRAYNLDKALTTLEQARRAFNEAAVEADQLLLTTPTYYAAQYTKCLAKFGLALLDPGQQRTNLLKQFQTSLKDALGICAKPGVLNDYLKLGEALEPLDSTGVMMLTLRRGFGLAKHPN